MLIEDSEIDRVKKLLALEEKRTNSLWHIEEIKNRVKTRVDKKVRNIDNFQREMQYY